MTSRFQQYVRKAIKNQDLQVALERNAEKRKSAREEIIASSLQVEQLRQRVQQIRSSTLDELEHHLECFRQQIESNGFIVHYAQNDIEARQIIIDLAIERGAKLIVKSKSMVSEEIHLNQALEKAGMQVVETDLGEFIVQLRDEPPSHIVAPAVHLRREDVGQTFQEKLGVPYTEDVEVMNKTAHDFLRQKFLTADVGISGVNFGVAETGTICIVTNEGNGRMVTTIPRIHIAIMGIERLVPSMTDLEIMLRLLPRFATGQKLTSYVSLIQGPREADDPDGPHERHLILLDNGRLAMRETPLQDALLCIRCGSCLDFCPVYQEIGGHPYESTYTGPIGSVITPALFGLEAHGHLANASTLCGACQDACPVDIDLPKLLLRVRADYVARVPQLKTKSWMIRAYTWIMQRQSRLMFAQTFTSWGSRLIPKLDGWGSWLPALLSGWTKSRNFPPFTSVPFRKRFNGIEQRVGDKREPSELRQAPIHQEDGQRHSDPVEQLSQALNELGGEFIHCTSEEAGKMILSLLHEQRCDRVLAWNNGGIHFNQVMQELRRNEIAIIDPLVPLDDDERYKSRIQEMAKLEMGITGAIAAFADTGTLVLSSGSGLSQLASLLPSIHVAIFPANKIYPSMSSWLETQGGELIRKSQNVVLISGPSRTADIEMTLSIGVHGPGRVIAFCVE